MGALPSERVVPALAFTDVGLDFTGPIYLKNEETGHMKKLYICIFTCTHSRMVHFELVNNMTTEEFLAALRRMINRRGWCKKIISDNQLTFKKAEKIVQLSISEYLARELNDETVQNYLAENGTGISTLLLHSSGIRSPINSLLNSLIKKFIPISPMHFQTSTGNSSGPIALPFFILLSAFFTSSLLTQFTSSLTTSGSSVLGSLLFFSFISFSKYSFHLFNTASEFIITLPFSSFITLTCSGCEREVKKRVQAGWNRWRKVSGVICDKRLPARVKGKVYSSVIRPAMVYGLETVAVTKKQVEEMEVAEIKMLRFTMGVTRKDKIRNKHIRSTVKVERLGMKMMEGRLRWYGHVMRRDQEYVGRKMMEMELPGKRKRGRPKKRFLDVVKEDMKEVGAKEMDIEDRKMWRMMIRCGHP